MCEEPMPDKSVPPVNYTIFIVDISLLLSMLLSSTSVVFPSMLVFPFSLGIISGGILGFNIHSNAVFLCNSFGFVEHDERRIQQEDQTAPMCCLVLTE